MCDIRLKHSSVSLIYGCATFVSFTDGIPIALFTGVFQDFNLMNAGSP